MPTPLHKAIKDCINSQGVEIIRSVRLANYLADVNAYDEVLVSKRVLKDFLNDGYGAKVAELYTRQLPWQKKMQAFSREFIDKYGFKESVVTYTLECLEYGLGWIDKEPQYEPNAPSIPASYNKGSFIPDMNKQLALMQKEYLSMLEQLITVPKGGLYKKSGYYSASALSQLWVVENKIDIISAALGANYSDWCKNEKQKVLDKYAQGKGQQYLMVFLKVVLPAMLGLVLITKGIQYLSSIKEMAEYKSNMENANLLFNSGDYRSALFSYQEAQDNYTGSFSQRRFIEKARESAENASAKIIEGELRSNADLIETGHYYDAKMKLDSLSLLPCPKETFKTLNQKKIDLDNVIQTALVNSRITLSLSIARNKGKLDKAGKDEVLELLKVAPNDYWLNFIKNKEKIEQ